MRKHPLFFLDFLKCAKKKERLSKVGIEHIEDKRIQLVEEEDDRHGKYLK